MAGDQPKAVARERLRSSLRRSWEWLASHDLESLGPQVDPSEATIEVVERVPATGDPLGCDSEGFFEFDRAAYSDEHVTRTRTLLEHTRADLRGLVDDLPSAVLDYRLVDGRRTVREVIDHIAITEHWYLTRVDLPVDVPGDWRAYPEGTFARLAETRDDVERVLEALPTVPSARRPRTWTVDGEQWSHRKLLRRLVWHEWLHTGQLERLIPKVRVAVG